MGDSRSSVGVVCIPCRGQSGARGEVRRGSCRAAGMEIPQVGGGVTVICTLQN